MTTSSLTGATSSGLTVGSGDFLLVSSGGVAVATMVSGGGTENVAIGGVASLTTVSNGGIENVFAGGMVSGTVVLAVGHENVSSGGQAVGTILSGGEETVFFSGTVSNTVVTSGGILTVSSGGVANFITVGSAAANGGVDYVFAGGQANGTMLQFGGTEYVFGGVASGTVVSAGGTQEVRTSGAVASATIVYGAEFVVSGGTATGSVISNGGLDVVNSSGTVSDTVVQSGGMEFVEKGGSANFTTVSSGGTQVVNSGGSATDTLVNLGGAIDVTYLPYVSGGSATVNTSGVLTVSVGGQTYTEPLGGTYAREVFALTQDTIDDGTLATLTTAPCYCRGTRILTEHGEIAVERLAIGDRVVTADGDARPIRWIGNRTVYLSRHPAPQMARPVLIRANAVADGVPHRDLLVSPDHAVLIDGLLVLARTLVNGGSIEYDLKCDTAIYYHVELETHDILLAEALPAESYLDTGNRGLFENADIPLTLHPDFLDGQLQRQARSCRPFADYAASVEPIWRRLATRAADLGFGPPAEIVTTEDPGLHIVMGGRAFDPVSVWAGCYTFVLPRVDGAVRLVSRAGAPSEVQPWLEDSRRLGICVRRLTLKRGMDVELIPLDHPLLSFGWWEVEHDRTSLWRWTDGDAVVPLSHDGAVVLEVSLASSLNYSRSQEPGAQASRATDPGEANSVAA